MLEQLWHNPLRSPVWPWLRATGIVDGTFPGLSYHRDGREGCKRIRPIIRYIRAWRRCTSDAERAQLALHCPHLFWAHSIFLQDNAPAKWLIEARLLARESDYEIASRIGCSPEIVKCYHDTFFDVREKLDFRDYVTSMVFGEAAFRGLSERQHDLLWKMFGYLGGPFVIDSVSSRLINASWCNSAEAATSFWQETALNAMKHKAAVATLVVPINSETHLDLIGAFVKYVEIERTTDSQGQARDQIVDNIQQTLTMLSFSVVSQDKPLTGVLEQYDKSGVELHTDEMITLSLGGGLPYADMLKNMHFPPPPLQLEVTVEPTPEPTKESTKEPKKK